MNDYDFTRLNDKEFEVFCTDIIGAMKGVRFERFKPGRDGGVDGRYFTPEKGEWILQCKHWASTPYSRLVAHLRDSEAPKVAKLRPERYFLVLSHPLSRENKSEIVSLVKHHTSSSVEVFGREDLNDFLSNHPEVERRHFKLWISSSNVLALLLNNAIKGRSDFMVKDIIEKSAIYVTTPSFKEALETLEKLGAVVITGQAGIGKTTLAEQVILQFVSNNFELVCISHDISEAEQAYDPARSQIFYFDDFLGRNYLQALTGHEGSQIVNFIKRVGRDKSKKKFILTSRTTILNQGRILNDAFDNNNIKRNELELRLSTLSNFDKAQILYNHIWHSNLPPEHVEQFYPGKRYRRIIEHKNFNPRVISFITDPQRIIDLPLSDYWRHVTESLDNPAKIWEHPFESQLDDFGRIIVLLVALNGMSLTEADLAAAYARAISMPLLSHMRGNRDFQVSTKHLTNSMLNRVLLKEQVRYNLFNPSLGDFLLRRYSCDTPMLAVAFTSLRSRSAIDVLINMSKNKFISDLSAQNLLLGIFKSEEDVEFVGSDPEYISKLCLAINERSTPESLTLARTKKAVTFVLASTSPLSYASCAELLLFGIDLGLTQTTLVEKFAISAMRVPANDRELPHLGAIVNYLERHNMYAASEPFAELAQNYLLDAIDEVFDESEIFGGSDNVSTARSNLQACISQYLANWGISHNLEIIHVVSEHYDISTRIEKYFEPQDDQPMRSHFAQQTIDIDSIDDLFQRDR